MAALHARLGVLKACQIIGGLVVCLLIVLLVWWGMNMASTPSAPRVHCGDFTTQSAAQQAYKDGATYLDGDHDGRACEALP